MRVWLHLYLDVEPNVEERADALNQWDAERALAASDGADMPADPDEEWIAENVAFSRLTELVGVGEAVIVDREDCPGVDDAVQEGGV